MIKRAIPIHTILAFIKYYEQSLMLVSNNGQFSCVFKTTVGVRQGGVASPKLFSIYINTLVELLIELDEGIRLKNIKLDVLIYADDIIILSETKQGLQRQLNQIESFGVNFDIRYNPKKTVYMVFNEKIKRC